MGASPTSMPFHGWRMVALAFVVYNVGLTLVINTLGPAIPVMQRELGASRASVSMSFGILMLSMSVLAPVAGNLMRWIKLRTLMMVGSALNATGFLLLAYAQTLPQTLMLFGLMIGPGVCLLAIISAPTLISRWFEHDRGKALGIGLVQVAGLVAAPFAAWLLASGGRALLFLTLAGIFVALIPVLRLVIESPESVGQTPRRAAGETVTTAIADLPVATNRQIFTDPRFWMLSIVVGIMTAAGVTLASQGTAMATAKGASLSAASMVLSASGAGALLGAFLFGWLIDRIGPFTALFTALVATAVTWLIFSAVTSLPLILLLAAALGTCMGPAIALHSACMNEIFGTATFSRAMGYSYFIKLPFLFGPAPLAGWLYDLSGGYGSTYAACVGGIAIAALLAVVLGIANRRHMPGAAVPAPS